MASIWLPVHGGKAVCKKVPIRLWEVATGENIATFWGHTTDVQCFAFSQDGTLLASGGHDGAIYLWDSGTLSIKYKEIS